MSLRSTLRQYAVSVRALLVAVIILGIAFPAVVLGIGQLALPAAANGSPARQATATATIGSNLIGQSFTTQKGTPLRQWFQSRPSVARSGYDGAASSGSNLGPDNPVLVDQIRRRRAAVASFNGVPPSDVPPDALTASASGLDPDISPAYARIQVDRVAVARGLSRGRVAALVEAHVTPADLGFLGDSRVNVLQLNAALQRMSDRTAH